jgi:hypothetical protein
MDTVSRIARMAGFLYLLMLPFAIFSLYVRFTVFAPDDALTTLSNISESYWMIRAGILTWFIQQTISIFLVLSLYKLLVEVEKGAAKLMVVLLLVGVPIAFVNEFNQLAALLAVENADLGFDPAMLSGLVMLFLNLHEYGTVVVHVFWGLWLFPFGYLIVKANNIPSILGILLIIAGIGYLVDFTTALFFPAISFTVTQITFVGEIIFPLWLLIKGVKQQPLNKATTVATSP